MKIDLKEYFTKKELFKELSMQPGPVVTISRQFGCGAIPLAEKLIARLNKGLAPNDEARWDYISKEIVSEAAEDLKLKPHQIEESLSQVELGILNDIFNSFKQVQQVSYDKISKAIAKVVESYAYKGHTIIIGMGGCVLAQDIKESLDVRIVAPLEWRIEQIYKSRNMSRDEAVKFLRKQDARRNKLKENLYGETYDESMFDVVLNRVSLGEDALIDVILHLMNKKGLLH